MFYKILSMLLITAPLAAVSQNPSNAEQEMHRTIKTDELKSWYDQKKPMTVLDARTKEYFDGRLLPNAKWLPADASEQEIVATVPDKEGLIVVYCGGD